LFDAERRILFLKRIAIGYFVGKAVPGEAPGIGHHLYSID
jgi:hypothetical protein